MPNAHAPAPRPLSPACLRDLGVQIDLLAKVTVDTGALRWLQVTPCASALRVHGRGVELLRVEETHSVPVLEVTNHSPWSVLLPSETVLRGGLQTRMVERSVVVPASASASVPVRCVERARWEEDGRGAQFSTGAQMSSTTRARLRRSPTGSDQRTVWREVDEDLERTQTTSVTSSYEAVQQRVGRATRATRARLGEPPAEANGALLLFQRGFGWLEVFPHRDGLVGAIDGLLAGFVDDGARAERTSTRRASTRIVDDVLDARLSCQVPPNGVGHPYSLEGALDRGHALFVEGRLAHLAACVGYQ